jgi:hypothetical protein
MSKLEDLIFGQVSPLMQLSYRSFCGEIILWCRTKPSVDWTGDIGDDALDLALHFGAFSLQLSFYLLGGLRNQLVEKVPRNVFAKANTLSENRIPFWAPHQVQEAGVRKVGANVRCDWLDNFFRSSNYQDVSYSFGNALSPGDGKQVLLTFGSRAGDQRLDIEPLRLSKDRPSDIDRVVRCKSVDYFVWRVVAGSSLVCQSNARAEFNFLGEPTNDFAESPNLVFRIGAGNQDIGRVPQSSWAAFGSSFGNRVFQVGQKRLGFSHLTGSVGSNDLQQIISNERCQTKTSLESRSRKARPAPDIGINEM